MPGRTPTPNLSWIEPRTNRPYRHFFHVWEALNVPADNPGSIGINLGALAPWSMRPVYIELGNLRIAALTAAARDVYPDITLDSSGGSTGYVPFEKKALGGTPNPDGGLWVLNMPAPYDTAYPTMAGPYIYIRIENVVATEDFNIYLDGFFFEKDMTSPEPAQSVVVEKIHEWPWVRRS